MERILHCLGMLVSRKALIKTYDKSFYLEFKKKAKIHLDEVIARAPDIGESVFKFNYQFAPAYIAWYKALKELGLDQDTVIHWIWQFNESMLKLPPGWLMKWYGRNIYLKGFRKKAPEQEQRSIANAVHDYDFQVRFRDIDANTFEIDILTCGMKKLSQDFDAGGLFPDVCRMDYLISNIMGCGFSRTKTLGDGDEMCNCRYSIKGYCAWNPEQGFEERK